MISIAPKERSQIELILAPIVAKGYRVYAFGSRVKNQHRSYSDLDLLIEGQEALPKEDIYKLQEAFEESDLPFRVDISDSAKVSDSFKTCIKNELVKLL